MFLVALTAFVGLTTSIFSRPYMRIEREHGRLNAARLRLYHSMFQLFNFTMLLALLTNNMGILWVALEAATLTTVLLVEQNLGVVRRIARDAIVLDQGRVVHTGDAQELLGQPDLVRRLLSVGSHA